MMKIRTVLLASLSVATMALVGCSSSMGHMDKMDKMNNMASIRSTLSAANEVPTNASAGTGTLHASLNKDTNVLTWTVNYSGLTGSVMAGHFHGPAVAGQNAGVALAFSGSMDSPIKGSATLTPAQSAELLAGKWYVNLHTAANKGGEIRGQAVVAP